MPVQKEQWFASWFDTPYYHILYQDRDHSEARTFMELLTSHIGLVKGSRILDLACGRGRHSIFLNAIGYDVVGADLSSQSIAYASQFANESLDFRIHDMCEPFGEKFDAIFNLFTSFGYFENENDNLRTLKAIYEDLDDDGIGVIDFMNVPYVINTLVPQETKTIDTITFDIQRFIKGPYIFKDIRFRIEEQDFCFTERVRAFVLSDFEALFAKASLRILEIFGDYHLEAYNTTTSPRLILIFGK